MLTPLITAAIGAGAFTLIQYKSGRAFATDENRAKLWEKNKKYFAFNGATGEWRRIAKKGAGDTAQPASAWACCCGGWPRGTASPAARPRLPKRGRVRPSPGIASGPPTSF